MNTTALLLIPLASAGLLTASPTSTPTAESKEQLRAYLGRLNADAVAPATNAALATKAPAPSALSTCRLQPSSGLQSAARGLSEKGDWQRRFPRYTKR